jgi:uncharacterized Zn finger protein
MSDFTPKINIRDTETIKCESCQATEFREVFILKKVSKLLTGTSEDTIVPIPMWACTHCGNILKESNPLEKIQDNDE